MEPEIDINDETPYINEESYCAIDEPVPVISLQYILENNPFVELDFEEEESDNTDK